MKRKLLPAIVSTIEALHNCSQSNYPLLYVMNSVYLDNKDAVRQFAVREGYTQGIFPAQNGLFLSKDVDPDRFEIYNPADMKY